MTSFTLYAWNAVGHRVVAQVAYDNLSPAAKHMCSNYFKLNDNRLESYFVEVSTWLDQLRQQKVNRYDSWHYIDIPFSREKMSLPQIKSKNALWAINKAIAVLKSNKTSTVVKAFYLKVLIHVIGDIHQPLHTITKVSKRLPEGDLGGNLYLLHKSPFGKNLHQYWDNGAGALKISRLKKEKLKVGRLPKQWACSLNDEVNPEKWLDTTHKIALQTAYSIKTHKKPSKKYRNRVIAASESQLALAGCRLAKTLNTIAALNNF